jgi:DNA-binding response OmpR family regulator
MLIVAGPLLPDRSGTEIGRELCDSDYTSDTPVVMCTAQGEAGYRFKDQPDEATA